MSAVQWGYGFGYGNLEDRVAALEGDFATQDAEIAAQAKVQAEALSELRTLLADKTEGKRRR